MTPAHTDGPAEDDVPWVGADREGGPQPDPSPADEDEQSFSLAEADRPRTTSVRRAFTANILTSGGMILFVFCTGVLTARLLSTDGRGQVASITSWILTLTWASSLGFPRAMAYYTAKGTRRADVVLATLVASFIPLGLIGVGLALLFLPYGYAAQSQETKDLAGFFFLWIPFVIAAEAFWALLAGLERFDLLNWSRLAQPGLYLAGLLTLWALDRVTPESVLYAQVGSYALISVALLVYGFRTYGFARPSLSLTKEGMNYGLRLQGVALSELVTGRLDLMMLPAFVTATSVGFYSIAVNVTSMVMSLFGSLAFVVFPVATRQFDQGDMKIVHQGLRVTLYGGFVSVLVLAGLSPWLISLVYGAEYLDALPALWLLLPGVVMWASTSVLSAALQAAGLPGRASLAQIVGVVVTVVGLTYALPRYEIAGAAAVSSLAYTATLVVVLLTLRRVPSFSLRSALSIGTLGSDVATLWAAMRAKLPRRSPRP